MTVYASAVDSAKLLKATLRAAFPATKFSVRVARGTAYGYCDVAWTDGPTKALVETVTRPFVGSRFDGMTDMEESINSIMPDGRPTGLRGISLERVISARFARRLVNVIATHFCCAEVPVVVDRDGRYALASDSEGMRRVSPRATVDWYTAIHRAACDRSLYATTT